MDLQTLTQEVSNNTQIGKHDIQLIMNIAFLILINRGSNQTMLTIPQCGSNPELNLLISKI